MEVAAKAPQDTRGEAAVSSAEDAVNGEKCSPSMNDLSDIRRQLSKARNELELLSLQRDMLLSEREKTKRSIEELELLVKEYKKTVKRTAAENEKRMLEKKADLAKTIQEHEQAIEELKSADNFGRELVRRFEKLRAKVVAYKSKEEDQSNFFESLRLKLEKSEDKYLKFRDYAEEQMAKINQEYENINGVYDNELFRMKAAIKKQHVQIETLCKERDRKKKQVQELSSLCDDLVQKKD
ncbi:unnamed protein product [Soboliphyme baturini]|uniref:TACC_C domain-containing protein n=1 Tax=Soboliphyme baturini TaxID=241478 RepID=A0A183J037_9BILA|nr:unnamed protein product [Soboliphyme baturini]